MAGPSESTPPLENLRIVSEPSCRMGTSSDSGYVTASASETESAIPCSSATIFSAYSEPMSSEGSKADSTSAEDSIEKSKVHWSELSERSKSAEEEANVSNVEAFQSLQKHPTWGSFFRTFGDGGIYDYGNLEVGEKFAAGGQAELYHARVTWNNVEANVYDKEHGIMHVLKVFRKGTLLRDLQKQWPQGMFRQYEEIMRRVDLGETQSIRYTCSVYCGTLLPDGRFAFLLVREAEDLRALIDRCMKARTCIDCRPFSRKMEYRIMLMVAKAMVELHDLNIVHRDLKASNVLCSRICRNMGEWVSDFNVANGGVAIGDKYDFYVADFECSNGVVGTGFFRAPEILQALKDRVLYGNPHLFSKEADVYSYGMLCYEVLTGKLPFEGHPTYDFGLVVNGHRPDVPHYVEEWSRNLLYRCWLSNPIARPTFVEIVDLIKEAFHRHGIP